MGLPEPKYDKNNRNPQKTQKLPKLPKLYICDSNGTKIPQGWEPGSPLPLGYSSPGPVLAPSCTASPC